MANTYHQIYLQFVFVVKYRKESTWGELKVESIEGQGIEFNIALPII